MYPYQVTKSDIYQHLEPYNFLRIILKLSQNQNVRYSLSLPDYNQRHIKCCQWHNCLNVYLIKRKKFIDEYVEMVPILSLETQVLLIKIAVFSEECNNSDMLVYDLTHFSLVSHFGVTRPRIIETKTRTF